MVRVSLDGVGGGGESAVNQIHALVVILFDRMLKKEEKKKEKQQLKSK